MNPLFITAILFVAFAVGASVLVSATSTGLVVYRDRVMEQMQTQLTALFLFTDAARLSLVYLVSLFAVPGVLFFTGVGLFPIACCIVCLLMSPTIVFALLRSRRAKAISQALPDGLLQLAASMRAGATFTVALQSLAQEDNGPLGDELSLTLREHRIGARMEDALENLAERVHRDEMDLVVSAVLISQEVGGNLAEILQRLAETIRRKAEMEGKIKALTSQGMMQGYVVSSLPLAILGALSFIEPEVTMPIFSGLLGWITLSVMGMFQLAGALMIRKIVTIRI